MTLKTSFTYSPLRYKTVTVDSTITDLVSFAKQHGTTYKMMKVMNPWILKDQLVIEEEGKTYTIKIPHDAEIQVNELIVGGDSAEIAIDPEPMEVNTEEEKSDSVSVEEEEIVTPTDTVSQDGDQE